MFSLSGQALNVSEDERLVKSAKLKNVFMHRLNKIIRSPDRIGNEPDNWGKESGRGWKGIGNQK